MTVRPRSVGSFLTSRPETVARLYEGYLDWFRDVCSTRGFAPTRIHVGDPREDQRPPPRPESVRPLLADAVGKTLSARILRGGVLVNLEVTVAERQGRS